MHLCHSVLRFTVCSWQAQHFRNVFCPWTFSRCRRCAVTVFQFNAFDLVHFAFYFLLADWLGVVLFCIASHRCTTHWTERLDNCAVTPALCRSPHITSEFATSHSHIASQPHHIPSDPISWHHMTLLPIITSHHMTSHHITSNYFTSHHLTAHDSTSHHITSRHNTLHHIPSYHMPWHHTT